MNPLQRARRQFLGRLPLSERNQVLSALRNETTGGFILLFATVVALLWANLAGDSYEQIRTTVIGPEALHLDLDIATWAADGFLAIFFLVAGLELKREIVVGELRNPAEALLPVVAAVAGMVVPALIYVTVNVIGGGSLAGWAVPTATDIAFALAVLAVFGSALPTALRAFLLTLAVVDDLLAIIIIAIFFTTDLEMMWLLATSALLAIYAWLQRRRVSAWWIYVPLGVAAWAMMHASGVHATIAGVAIGLLTRVRHDETEATSPAERLEHRLRPVSAGVAVPLFALFAAGVPISLATLGEVFVEPEGLGIVLGLVVGKMLGIFGGTYLASRFSRAELNSDLAWSDVLGVSLIAGIGFTVSLLIGKLAFPDHHALELVKTAVLTGSLLAALLGVFVLRIRNRAYRQIEAEENRDEDGDGIPDVYQRG